MATTFEELRLTHPCFAAKHANGKSGDAQTPGRIHLPVCPRCNIDCNFCVRDNANTTDVRPGVAASVITPQEAVNAVRRALKLCPGLTVAGIAGPGDTLCGDYALDTFRLIKAEFPGLVKCMSTNGLELPHRAAEIIEIGIDSLTVTVNAVEPALQAQICGGIFYEGKRYESLEAAEILIKNQLAGIKTIADAGITVKVNTVLVNEINAGHVATVAKTVSELGAKIYNIIPLIPQGKLAWCSAPDCDMRKEVREQAEEYIEVFRHCQRCRADAVGTLGGKDFSTEVFARSINAPGTFSHG